MSAESITYQTLIDAPAVAELVAQRVYPDVAPQGEPLPLIVFDRSSSQPTYTIDGGLAAMAANISIACWASDRMDADQLAQVAADALQTAGCYSQDRRAGYDPETEAYATIIDCIVWE